MKKIKYVENLKERNLATLHILETKLRGKLKLPKDQTALKLLGRE
jgi:hypothetical protein